MFREVELDPDGEGARALPALSGGDTEAGAAERTAMALDGMIASCDWSEMDVPRLENEGGPVASFFRQSVTMICTYTHTHKHTSH